jgi:hypothetical protein
MALLPPLAALMSVSFVLGAPTNLVLHNAGSHATHDVSTHSSTHDASSSHLFVVLNPATVVDVAIAVSNSSAECLKLFLFLFLFFFKNPPYRTLQSFTINQSID